MFAALIALLVGRGVASWLAGLIVYGVAAIVVFGTAAYFWESRVAHPYEEKGRALQAKEDGVKLDQLTRANLQCTRERDLALDANKQLDASINGPGGLAEQVAAGKQSIADLQTVAARAVALSKQLRAEFAARAKKDAAEIARLREIANGPPITEQVAERAAQILADLAAWRATP